MTTIVGKEENNSDLDFFHRFQSYLKAKMELSSFESAQKEAGRQQTLTKIKITVSNTAPKEPSWPKVVFMGVGLSIAYLGSANIGFSSLQLTSREEKPEETPNLEGPPWQHDEKFKGLSTIHYNHVVGQDFPAVTSYELEQGKVLFPGQSVIFEVDVSSEVIPYLQFRVDGTVSRRYLLHFEETLVMPETITKPPAQNVLSAFNSIDIHRALGSVIASMPDFNSDTRLAEIQAFSAALNTGMTEIKATQEAMRNQFGQHNMFWFKAHLRAAYICLDRVSAALARMKEAIATSASDKIAVEASAIRALRGDAAQFNRATEELMRKYNISDNEVNYRYRGQ